MSNLSALDHDGYTVISNFLNSRELEILRNDYNNTADFFGEYGIKLVSKSAIGFITNKINQTLLDITNSTSIIVDTVNHPQLYINNQKTYFDWHQDHESWYIEQESTNHVNLYMPLHKELPNKSGISIVPMTALADHINLFANKGARRFIAGETTTVIDDDLGYEFYLDFDINERSVTPNLIPGDLLIMRGDMIHKTQDSDTERYSISIRCTHGEKKISKSRLFSGCEVKRQYLEKNAYFYDRVKNAFGNEEYISLSKLLKELL